MDEFRRLEDDIEYTEMKRLRENNHNHNFDSVTKVCLYCGLWKIEYDSDPVKRKKCTGVSNK